MANEVNKTDSRLAARCAAVASLGAAVIHFGVCPMHWRDWLPAGVFFAALAVFQLCWALFVWTRPTAWVLSAGIAANVVSAVLWVVVRTAGLPWGPNAGQPEAVEAAGICVLLLQCYVVMGATWAWSRRYGADQVSGVSRAVVLLGASAVMVAAVTVGLASTVQGHQHHHGATEAQGERPANHEEHLRGHRGAPPAAPPDAVVAPAPAPAPAPSTPAPGGTGLPMTEMGLGVDDEPESAATETGLETDGHDHDHG